MVNLLKELQADFEEVSPKEFYRDIFPEGALDIKNKFTKGKYTGIAVEFCDSIKPNGKQLVKRYSITDELDTIDQLLKSENFIIISPISYIGKSRKTDNAKMMYAFAIELDNIKLTESGRACGYTDMLFQMQNKLLPYPNYLVASGHGLHLYYVLEKPLMLYPNVKQSLMKFKKAFTRELWNQYITDLCSLDKIQFESAFQGFRMAGGVTKNGDRTRIFKVTDTPITAEQLNYYVPHEEDYIEVAYESDLSLMKAKEKYPEWYQNRVVEGKKRGTWTVKRDLYDWWLRQIKGDSVKVGHRYYCLMCLSIYAIKCGISYEELKDDCFSLLEQYDSMTNENTNRFTKKDIVDALQIYEDKDFVTYPRDIISLRSGIAIKKNKRNYRKQAQHIKIMNAIRDVEYPNKEWINKEGRPVGSGTKQEKVQEWRKANPLGKKVHCIRDTGLSKPTVYKWWDKPIIEEKQTNENDNNMSKLDKIMAMRDAMLDN